MNKRIICLSLLFFAKSILAQVTTFPGDSWFIGSSGLGSNANGLAVFGGNSLGGVYQRGDNSTPGNFLGLGVHNGSIRFNVGWGAATEAMRITNTGKVGIGQTDPLNLFSLSSSDASSAMQFNVSGYPTQWGTRIFSQDSYNGTANGIDLAIESQYGSTWNKAASFSNGQDANHPSLRTWYSTYLSTNGGNVSIGSATSPQNKLDVTGNIGVMGGNALRFYNSSSTAWASVNFDGSYLNENYPFKVANDILVTGKTGIGTTGALINKLDVNGDEGILNSGSLRLYNANNTSWASLNFDGTNLNENLPLNITSKVTISGNVGIGTASATEKLCVNGNIKTQKLIVTQTGWSDYVFADDYKLQSIQQLESYIKVNKHLPDIPSAKEVKEQGISVGDNQALLLKKIEELTLYLIALKKENEQQQIEIKELQKLIKK